MALGCYKNFSTQQAGGAGGSSFLIPDTKKTVVHVTANDLNAGFSRGGPLWTKNGAPTFTAATGAFPMRAGVGGNFSNVINFTSPASGVLNFTGPFSYAMVLQPSAIAINETPFGNSDNTAGWYSLISATGFITSTPLATVAQTTTISNGTVYVVGGGYDGTLYWASVNGASTSAAGAAPLSTTSVAQIGSYAWGGTAFGGIIYEAWASTDVPSAAFFTALNNAVLSAGSYP